LGRIKRGGRRVPPLAVGALSSLLPCGALLTGVIAATGAGTPLGGAVVMLSFSLATAPALVLALWVSRRVRSLRPGRGALVMAALFFAGALLFVYRPIPGLVDPGAACCGEAPGAM
jgi:sulfite exporter TauE/SafE